MDHNFKNRWRKTLYSGDVEPGNNPLTLTDLAVDFFQELGPQTLGQVDLDTASTVTSQETVSPASVTMGMIYARRLQKKRPDYVKKISSSDLFIISMMMASKYLYDEGVDEEVFNDEWAENSDIDKDEINQMEMEFLNAIEWEMFIHKKDFDSTITSVERSIALKEGLKRGWFSYTDLYLLLDDPHLRITMASLNLEWLKVILVSSAGYVTALMTMVGSTILVTNTSMAIATTGLPLIQLPTPFWNLPTLYETFWKSNNLPITLSFHPNFNPTVPPSLIDSSGKEDNEKSDDNTTSESFKETELLGPDQNSLPTGWLGGESVVNTIMSQLMAVLTLKSHLVQFATAVSEGYKAKKHPFFNHLPQQSKEKTCLHGNKNIAPTSDNMNEEIPTADQDDQTSILPCLMQRMAVSHPTPGQICSRCHQCKGQDFCLQTIMKMLPIERRNMAWIKRLNHIRSFSNHLDCHVPSTKYSCSQEAAIIHERGQFQDLNLGFATSMPPIYAT